MNLEKPKKKKQMRLGCLQAFELRGFRTYKDMAKACEKHAMKMGLDLTFNDRAIQNYIHCYSNMSFKRLKVVADLLGVKNIMELEERFTEPDEAGVGGLWLGEFGSVVRDKVLNYTYLKKADFDNDLKMNNNENCEFSENLEDGEGLEEYEEYEYLEEDGNYYDDEHDE